MLLLVPNQQVRLWERNDYHRPNKEKIHFSKTRKCNAILPDKRTCLYGLVQEDFVPLSFRQEKSDVLGKVASKIHFQL